MIDRRVCVARRAFLHCSYLKAPLAAAPTLPPSIAISKKQPTAIAFLSSQPLPRRRRRPPSSSEMCNLTSTSYPKSNLLASHDDLRRHPTLSELAEEMRAIGKISVPAAVTGLMLYSRAMISMLFLGYLGELELAAGSLAIGFANITGYSVLSGLAMGMEPICAQAFGADRRRLLGLTLQRATLLLLCASLPIVFLWLNARAILLRCGQDEEIATVAQVFVAAASPDLLFLSFLHPLRVFLRAQNITLPITYCSSFCVALHCPLTYLLAVRLRLGIAGVAAAMVLTNLNFLVCLLLFLLYSGACRDTWPGSGSILSGECLRGWPALLRLAAPSCVSVCLEWWWYELMILLSGLLAHPRAAVASMGILIQTTSLVYVFPSALSFGVSTRVGNVLGANRPTKARAAAAAALAAALALGLAATAFTASMRHQWGRLFTRDAEILHLTSLALPIAGLCELGNCPQTAGCGVLRGSARPATGANINLGSFYFVGMPVAILLSFVGKMGLPGLWLGLLAAQAACATLMACAVARTDWAAEAERARELTNSSSSPTLPITNSNGTIPITTITTALSPNSMEAEKKKKTTTTLEDILSIINADAPETAPLILPVD
ncbi:protein DETOXIFICATION 48-like [Zingiber officinale]|uniref:protein DETOXIFICATION 48-like n=1 Tax=Zingiber officinale TaxID=94328 RepID=UPI001C4B5B0C|nr:protein DETOXIFICATION 48-like [Zingiber officinale]XP_042468171.1 protein DETOXIFICATION 48-like [Zingiber officinale]XP_042468173.1 protein DETOXIFICATION 48-like [Zingiber officinale]XP_042468174.1 protein DETOXIFICATION 48-like [Zingiber officinale]XP_042468175.1 protein DETOXIFICATION 48-like [Zingiber officinale]XP_042468176.1 protein DETOXIFICATION 48-like [Zingiber officinale]XP_042468177.1 protein DETOXIFICATION 48-like [Zingiber officinale]XP_042468178.1 protein DETOXIFICATION 4